ncbi:GGDEF domain-containing protein [Ectopseudomonas mendocina]|uniref:diguanylate cyclase n=1 Tax=Ectopseudomonas mendocina TaxID=300 RepID=A0ABZ2RHL8_ECTME
MKLAFAFPLIQCSLLTILINTQEPRQLVSSLILLTQCGFIMRYSLRYALPGGRAHWVLLIGCGTSLIGLGIRAIVILSGSPVEMNYDVSNLRQTISIAIGAVTIIMLSFGLVLLSRERIEADLKQMALHDPLTGISNRLSILKQLDEDLSRSRRTGVPLSIAMVDIDYFKQINDRYGHLVGDSVLCHFTQHLQQRLRSTDRVGRYGGEEFLIILHGTDAKGSYDILTELRTSLMNNPARVGSDVIPLTFSAGIFSFISPMDEDVKSILVKADTALYEAKNRGRNALVQA